MLVPEGWTKKQKILLIFAHPDDPEFFCGATVKRWVSDGHFIEYCLFTKGEKGSLDPNINIEELKEIREFEQFEAAKELGVKNVTFLNYPDGELVPSMDTRKSAVRVIRQVSPDVVVTGDPNNLFPRPGRINHPDHRAIGQIVIDAIFPAVGNPHYFCELFNEGLHPHKVQELWLANSNEADIELDVTQNWEIKINALLKHASQISDTNDFIAKIRGRHTKDSSIDSPIYIEKFRRIIFE